MPCILNQAFYHGMDSKWILLFHSRSPHEGIEKCRDKRDKRGEGFHFYLVDDYKL